MTSDNIPPRHTVPCRQDTARPPPGLETLLFSSTGRCWFMVTDATWPCDVHSLFMFCCLFSPFVPILSSVPISPLIQTRPDRLGLIDQMMTTAVTSDFTSGLSVSHKLNRMIKIHYFARGFLIANISSHYTPKSSSESPLQISYL